MRRETVLGVDPGIANTGLAIVVRTGSGYKLKALRCIESKADEPEPQRLLKIYDTVDALLTKHNVDLAAIERVYHNKNVSSSIKTGKAIGAVLCAIGAHAKTAIEVTPQQVKQSTGLGGKADKECVRRAMARILRVDPKLLNAHTADASLDRFVSCEYPFWLAPRGKKTRLAARHYRRYSWASVRFRYVHATGEGFDLRSQALCGHATAFRCHSARYPSHNLRLQLSDRPISKTVHHG